MIKIIDKYKIYVIYFSTFDDRKQKVEITITITFILITLLLNDKILYKINICK